MSLKFQIYYIPVEIINTAIVNETENYTCSYAHFFNNLIIWKIKPNIHSMVSPIIRHY